MTLQQLHSAVALHQQGHWREAAEIYRQILGLQPKNPDALNLLGVACCQLGDYPEGIRHLRKCVKIQPGFARAHGHLGEALLARGDLREALISLRRAVSLNPELAEVHCNLGLVLHGLERFEEAEANFRKALSIQPGQALTWNHLGNTLLYLEKFSDAAGSFQRAMELFPGFSIAHNNLGIALSNLGDIDGAERCFRQTLATDPGLITTYGNLAGLLLKKDCLLESEQLCRKALTLDPNYVDGLMQLGSSLRFQGRYAEAESYMLSALKLQPDNPDVLSGLLYLNNFIRTDVAESSISRAKQYGRSLSAQSSRRFSSWSVDHAPSRLRVGFVSGDLNNHPVGHFIESVLSQLDPERLELIAYPASSLEDELTARIRPRFSAWRPIHRLNDKDAAALIHEDGVHLLVDLSGHTVFGRLQVFSWKPAPLQVSWLGYFGTTGVAEMDYFIADEVGVPREGLAFFTEKIWYLPETRLCFTAPQDDIPVSPLPAQNKGFVTFGCFQNSAKIGDEVLKVWARVLAALPGARLRLQAGQYEDPILVTQLRDRFRSAGGDVERMDIFGSMLRHAYLAAHETVDIVLDTFPYPGGTTTCEALWMGVPTLSLAGNTLIARQGASLLTAAGLQDWITLSEEDYVGKAIAFANDLPALAALRAGLRQQVLASPLFDAPRFARNLENAFHAMWNGILGSGRLRKGKP